jgi:predicted metal-dependent phosphoesterase TrpH
VPGSIVDLHLHTVVGGADSRLEPDELMIEATRVGLSGVNITEHDLRWDEAELCQLRSRHPHLFVSHAIEVTTDHGHVLAVGLKGYAPEMYHLPRLREIADEQDAFLVVAHPFRRFFDRTREGEDITSVESASRLPVFQYVDGIEVLNGYNAPRENYLALQVAKYLGKPGTSGSDAHMKRGIGYYGCVFEETVETEERFLELLHNGRFYTGRELTIGRSENVWECAEPQALVE